MDDGRPQSAQRRDFESPAVSAGLSRSGRIGGVLSQLRRPEIDDRALHGFRRELAYELCFPVASGLMEGGFIGVVADKIFQVHPSVLALITAAPMFGNLSSFLWARLARGRPKVPLLVSLQVLVLGAVAGIALLPAGPEGTGWLVAIMVVSRLAISGIITLRSLVWTLNYPRIARARVTARLQFLMTLTMTAASVGGGLLLDADPVSFRIFFAGAAIVGSVGVLAFSRVRLLDEEAHLSLENTRAPAEASDSVGARRASVWSVLRDDPLYARYQGLQFLLGSSNMMVEAPLIYLVSRELQASYAVSISLTLAIPLGIAMLTLPFWATYIDRVHIAEFRARHSWLWVVAQFFTWLGALYGSLGLIGVGRVVQGLAWGGGSLAWQLGHNDFAKPGNVGLYMGIHVTLTGLRGALFPFVGVLLYVGWSGVPLPGTGRELPGFAGIGGQLMLLASFLSTLATLGYHRLYRSAGRPGK